MSQPTSQRTRVGQSREGHVAGSERRTGPGAGRTGSIRSKKGDRGGREERGERGVRVSWAGRNKGRKKEGKKSCTVIELQTP